MRNKILKEIEQANVITIFRHQFPDMDALGSQLGLAQWIKDTYPNKQVYCLGNVSENAKVIDKMDEASDEIIASSLSIILDTANGARVDDQRYTFAKSSVRIDHHVQVETLCDIEWIDEKASATCELLALFFQGNDIQISSKAAQYLYCGLVADNIRFTTSNTRMESFQAAQYLVSCGVDLVACEQLNFSSSLQDFRYETCVRNKSKVYEKALCSIMEIEDYTSCGLNFSSAKEKVYALSGIDEIKVWAMFTRMEDGIHYSASLRSRNTNVRDIAQTFGGGGHICACGIKNLTIDQVNEIISQLAKRSLEG